MGIWLRMPLDVLFLSKFSADLERQLIYDLNERQNSIDN